MRATGCLWPAAKRLYDSRRQSFTAAVAQMPSCRRARRAKPHAGTVGRRAERADVPDREVRQHGDAGSSPHERGSDAGMTVPEGAFRDRSAAAERFASKSSRATQLINEARHSAEFYSLPMDALARAYRLDALKVSCN